MPVQERDTPIRPEVLPARFMLIGVAVAKAKPVVFSRVVSAGNVVTVGAVPSIFFARSVTTYLVVSVSPENVAVVARPVGITIPPVLGVIVKSYSAAFVSFDHVIVILDTVVLVLSTEKLLGATGGPNGEIIYTRHVGGILSLLFALPP